MPQAPGFIGSGDTYVGPRPSLMVTYTLPTVGYRFNIETDDGFIHTLERTHDSARVLTGSEAGFSNVLVHSTDPKLPSGMHGLVNAGLAVDGDFRLELYNPARSTSELYRSFAIKSLKVERAPRRH
jgi:hypothetical protein